MFRKYSILLLCLLFTPLCASASVPQDQQGEHQEGVGVFGILQKDTEGKETFVRTDIVPLVENQTYGWIIRLKTGLKVKWKEEFILPAPPETWGEAENDGAHRISGDRKVSVTEREVLVKDGTISNFWSVAPGDPVGQYVIRVYVNGALVESFRFKCVAPTSPNKLKQPTR
jgi:hypothetical protein